ncbi:MAG: hypothetical protein A2W27_11020 [Deltaproteobacteria bacterium RBG_16_44_11]|nr:MAG: hypothetical protein A2W27_11020 [Deltaproteobacteria bacterium RBG_16_44_11]
MNNENDPFDILNSEQPLESGVYGLWLHIFCMSVFELLNGRCSPVGAEAFLFDSENFFFDFVADKLGYEPGKMRNRIREALKG